jgi:hypothetical protein
VENVFTSRRLPAAERTKLLRRIAARAGERSSHGPGVLVFDLDGTLMDNRPRVVAILRELAEEWRARHPEAAASCEEATPDRIVYGFVENLRRLGIQDPALHERGLAFWKERFFADPHMRFDTEVPGARDYVRRCHEGGAVIVYLTGRDLPNMALGSFASLRDLGFPIGVVGTELVVKPSFDMPDSEFKRAVAPALSRLGTVVGVFDNEPVNCNLLLAAHPGSASVFLDTQYAPDPPPLADGVEVIDSFLVEP